MRNILALAVAISISAITSAATIQVPADYPTIQDAVNAATSGDEIVVAPGVYTGTGDSVVDYLGKTLSIRSNNGPGLTFIDGQGARRGVTFSGGEAAGTALKGFTIQNGLAPSSNDEGGGLWSSATSSPVITNCVVKESTAWYGSGMMIRGAATVVGCDIIDNHSYDDTSANSYGGGVYCLGEATFIGCDILNNGSYWGGGIAFLASNATLQGCTMAGNNAVQGGGAYVRDFSPTLNSCTLAGNSAEYGGGLYLFASASPGLTGTVIEDNFAEFSGGGVVCYQHGPTTFENCTIASNVAPNGGGFWVYLSQDTLTLTECRVTDNDAGGIRSNTAIVTLEDTLVCGNVVYQIDGVWTDAGGNDLSVECATGACCTGDACSVVTLVACLATPGGSWLGADTLCDECPTIETGACCLQEGLASGGCLQTDFMTCDSLGGDWLGPGSDCTGCEPPPQPGGCCVTTGCLLLSEENCMMLGGLWLGDSIPCTACPPTGACCTCDGCIVTWESECDALGGDWLQGLPCTDCPPPCSGDINGDGIVDGADLSALLATWGVCP